MAKPEILLKLENEVKEYKAIEKGFFYLFIFLFS